MSTQCDSIDISQLKAQVLGLDTKVSKPEPLQCLHPISNIESVMQRN